MTSRAIVPLTLVVLFAGLGAEPAGTGNITGQVRFTGKVPEPKAIPTTDGMILKHNDLVVDAKCKGLRHVAVILEDAPAQPKVEKAEPALIDQKEMIFLPRVVAVREGQAVRFENSDQFNHSVQAISTVAANQLNQFVGPNQPLTQVFAYQPRPVMIGCSLHGWMRAWVYVVRHPWFAVTEADGQFRIANVPPGKYTLLLTHADTGMLERRMIAVEAGKTTTLTVDWEKAERK
jgi:plastocyanin